ncbi:hypothetical protein FHW20_003741 [Ochrobactrum intermedium]|uniref:Uncharacterized protein n=1 Tax=Brucella intermedia TaxID=94625 RepID=A0ABR6ATI1_9HYPH|nr:hypothetical protein O206_13550 [Ochrobactrum sp. EGD-AQ16]MBA8852774.1 hypothetical protein [Brucella intermedia]NYD83767.1 hypothetical protein [Brucella intermedia]
MIGVATEPKAIEISLMIIKEKQCLMIFLKKNQLELVVFC